MSRKITDPVERIIETVLRERKIRYEIEGTLLDFYLPDFETFIECKQFHSDRIGEQMSRAPNVIAIQGIKAAQAFAHLLKRAEIWP